MKELIRISLAVATLVALFVLQSCDNYPKVIEKPEHGLINSTTLAVDKIVLTDTATILYIEARFQPNYWIRIDPATYLKAGNKKYILTGADSIQIGEQHWMPASGEDSFTLYFPPLPKGTKSIDFIESDCDDCFKIWDIDLTGKGFKYTPDIPKEVLGAKIDKNATLPPVELTTGKTTLNVYFTGLREGYVAGNPSLIINDPFLMTHQKIDPLTTEGNVYTYEFIQNGTAAGFILIGYQTVADVLLSPGETADVYIDMTARSMNTEALKKKLPPMRYAGFNGKYASLNTEYSLVDRQKYTPQPSGDTTDDILDMTPQDWVNKKKQEVEESIALINSDASLSPAAKALLALQKRIYCMNSVARIQSAYEWAYRNKHQLEYNDPMDYKTPAFDDDIIFMLKEFEPGNITNIYHSEAYAVFGMISQAISSDEKLNELTDTQTGIIQDVRKALPLLRQVENLTELTPEQDQLLSSLSMPLFKEAFVAARAEAKRKYDEALAKGGYVITDTPQAANNQLLEAIIAQHKGKALFIDFWATWCGPCLNAMQAIKPFKPEMKDKGVEVLYISGETSPKAKWMTMLPDIGGIHYYLTADQWSAVCDKYQISGIPSYIITDKNGKIIYQATGFPGVDKVREELSKVW